MKNTLAMFTIVALTFIIGCDDSRKFHDVSAELQAAGNNQDPGVYSDESGSYGGEASQQGTSTESLQQPDGGGSPSPTTD